MTSTDYRRAAEKLRAFSDEVRPITSKMVPCGVDKNTGRIVWFLELELGYNPDNMLLSGFNFNAIEIEF